MNCNYNPNENTIWVNTDTEIICWELRNDAPTDSSSAGNVCIVFNSSNSSDANAFQVLTNDNKLIYISVKRVYQYISDTWDAKEAYIYKNSTWTELSHALVLYDYGIENTEVIGEEGFKFYNSYAIAQKNEDHIALQSSSKSSVPIAIHSKTIDVSDYTVLKSIVDSSCTNSSYYQYFRMAIKAEGTASATSIALSAVTKSGEQELTIDLSDVTHEICVGFTALDSLFKIYKVWCE